MNLTAGAREADVVLECEQFAGALSYYLDELGFRLDVIFPADAPRVAALSGYGLRLRLQSFGGNAASHDLTAGRAPLVSKGSAGREWHTGRAGMLYRDLIPGRQGGALIASHIRIPDGGPVPDYVHYHHVGFQIIYCYKGWVRLVYEGQGPPFVARAGDCILQPPGIRHRVLECSDGFDVVEIGSPAEHETFVDHAMQLPTGSQDPQRSFEGQRFVWHRAADADWRAFPAAGFEYRDTGISTATQGMGSVQVIGKRGSAGSTVFDGQRDCEFFFLLRGSVALLLDGVTYDLTPCDSFVVPDRMTFEFSACADDLELLYVSVNLTSDRPG